MIGTQLGSFEITGKLGEGGMGEVYRATDSRLKRDVAIKVLPAAFTEDPERLARFEREAQLLAQLHHPNIASIFGIEESDGLRALVMELVEGPTLAERLANGSLSLGESLSIARQIAEALEEAHEKGIIHRDLKPQNIKSPQEGTVKVLDFGLAKAMDPAAGSTSVADLARSPTLLNSPTLTAVHGTQMGVILGTAAYMAPEQARGSSVDKRADIWAFGVVFYEMLVGRSLFSAETVTDTLAGVLKTEIDFAALPASTPIEIRQLLRRCLQRNPKNRLHDIADARIVIDEVAAGGGEQSGGGPLPSPQPSIPLLARWLPWAIATLAVTVAIVVSARHRGDEPIAPQPAIRFEMTPPELSGSTRRGSGFELSPDGRYVALAVDGELWVRAVDALSFRRIEGIEDATYPFWSPDGAWIGFFAQKQLMRVPRDGGSSQRICDAPNGRGAAMAPDGTIVFSFEYGAGGLWQVSAQGGEPVPVTELPSEAINEYLRYPQFLPDGRSFLYQRLAPSPELAGIYVATLGGSEPQRVLEGGDQTRYAPAAPDAEHGYLLYRRGATLLAQPFDPGRLQTVGSAVQIAGAVGGGANTGSGAFTVSAAGVLAYAGDWEQSGEMIWIDRKGERLDAVNAESREISGVALAPDGSRVAFGAGAPSDVWIQNLPSGEPSRFTFGPDPGWGYPLWSPDGSELVYASYDLSGYPEYEIRRRAADRSGVETTLLRSKNVVYVFDWSPDGRWIVYADEYSDLWLLPASGDSDPVSLLEVPGNQTLAQFSPDGKLLAFASDAQGELDIFVGTIPPSSAVWQISVGGGSMPRWSSDGRELFFRSPDGTLMSVALGEGAGAAAIDGRAAARPLFVGIPSDGNSPMFTYEPSADGQRFLVVANRKNSQPPITIVMNWQSELEPSKTESGGS